MIIFHAIIIIGIAYLVVTGINADFIEADNIFQTGMAKLLVAWTAIIIYGLSLPFWAVGGNDEKSDKS